jgi:hypothetical protein
MAKQNAGCRLATAHILLRVPQSVVTASFEPIPPNPLRHRRQCPLAFLQADLHAAGHLGQTLISRSYWHQWQTLSEKLNLH